MLLIAFFAGLSEHLPLAQSQCTVLDIEWEPPDIRCLADGMPDNPGYNTEFYLNGSKKDFEEHFGDPRESSLDIHVTRESEGVFSCGLVRSTAIDYGSTGESEGLIILCKLISIMCLLAARTEIASILAVFSLMQNYSVLI